MENSTEKSFLGTGWSFPPAFREQSPALDMVSDEADIRQSLYLLMSTTPGERMMNPAYGCDLNSLVFDRISEALRQEIIAMVHMAILRFEPRITVDEILVHVVSYEPGQLHIVVEFTINQTNSRSNIVFPYYLQEGTNVRL